MTETPPPPQEEAAAGPAAAATAAAAAAASEGPSVGSTASACKRQKPKKNRLSLTKQRAERRSAAAAAAAAAVAAGSAQAFAGDAEADAAAAAVDSNCADTDADINMGGANTTRPNPNADTAKAGMSRANDTCSDDEESAGNSPPAKATTSTSEITTKPRNTANTGTTTSSKPAYMRQYVDPDSLSAFQLCTRLSTDIPFMHMWHVMESQGWRHHDAKYYTPQGECLGSAIEVFRVLDEQGGMPPRDVGVGVHGGTGTDRDADGDRHRRSTTAMRKLRDDLLGGYFRHQQHRAREMEQRRKRQRKRKRNAADAAAAAAAAADGNNDGSKRDVEADGVDGDGDVGVSKKVAVCSGDDNGKEADVDLHDDNDDDDDDDDDDDSLGPALFGLDSEVSDASPFKSPANSRSSSVKSRRRVGDDDDKDVDDDAAIGTRSGGPLPHASSARRSARIGGGGDRGAEEYMRNKVGVPTAATAQTRRTTITRGAQKRAAKAAQKAAAASGNGDGDANNVDEIVVDDESNDHDDDDGDDEPEYHVWPNLETNVSTVRDYAVSISESGVQALDEDYVPDFDEWRFLLSTNHSVLLYGFGSKRSLLNDFAETILPHDGDVLTLDGYDRTIAIDGILAALVHLYLGGHEPRPRSFLSAGRADSGGRTTSSSALGLGMVPPTPGSPAVVRRAFAIAERIATTRTVPIYIVLHNIDGVGLRYRQTQDALAILVAASVTSSGTRMIRLVTSLDHVNGPATLWSTQTRAAFGWTWKEVHTYRPSFEEVRLGGEEGPGRKTRYGSSLGGSRASASSSGDGMGFMRVLESIGKRHAEALQVLAKEQYRLQKKSEGKPQQHRRGKPPQPTISYNSWKQMCMTKMCASDETGLRNMLTELTDHGIIAVKYLDDGRHLFVPHDLPVLKQILRFKPDAD